MVNHLLVAERLQYKRYFVRVSVQVGPRAKGGFEGELDVASWTFVPSRLVSSCSTIVKAAVFNYA